MSRKGSYEYGIGGYSLGDVISGVAPTGISEDRSEPPPSRCRWPGCRTILSITNRPTGKKRNRRPPDIPEDPGVLRTLVAAEIAGHGTGLAETVRREPLAPRRNDEPDDEALCRMHRRATIDWHQGLSEDRPAHYPPESLTPVAASRKKV